VLRGFVTHAKWNGDNGTVANGVFGTKKSGTSFGVQAEAWW
jgi:maltoporin